MVDIFPPDTREAVDKLSGDFIKAEEFEGEGLIIQFAKPLEKVVSKNPKYGADEKDFLLKNHILQLGQTFRYTFNTPDGRERKIDSKSSPLFLGFKMVEELGVGDWVHVKRTGKVSNTRYFIEKVEAPTNVTPVSQRNDDKPIDYPTEDINPDDVPF